MRYIAIVPVVIFFFEQVVSVHTQECVNVNIAVEQKRDVYANMIIHGKTISVQIDSGATTNIMPQKFLKDEVLSPTKKILTMYNSSSVKPIGQCFVRMKNPKTGRRYDVLCVIVDEDFCPLLGKRASEQMKLMTINYEQFESANVVRQDDPFINYSDVFDDTKPGNTSW